MRREAHDQSKSDRDRAPSASKAFAQATSMTTINVAKMHDATLLFVESKKIWMSGTRVGVSATMVMSPMEKQTEMRKRS